MRAALLALGLACASPRRQLSAADVSGEPSGEPSDANTEALRTFSPEQILIKKFIGQIGLATESFFGGSTPFDASRSIEQTGLHVRLFEADLVAEHLRKEMALGLGSWGKTATGGKLLLREFPGSTDAIGVHELGMYEYLHRQAFQPPPESVPEADWGTAPVPFTSLAKADEVQRAVSDKAEGFAHVAKLLGSMRIDASFLSEDFEKAWHWYIGSQIPLPQEGSLWLVYKYEGLDTVASFPRVYQDPLLPLLFRSNPQTQHKFFVERGRYVKAVAEQALQALSWLHSHGVVHRSLGGSSLLLNTYNQRKYKELRVKIFNLGFAACASQLTADDINDAMRRGARSPLEALPLLTLDDLSELGYTLLELVLSSFSEDGEPVKKSFLYDQLTLKRLVQDVYKDDLVGAFRDYVIDDGSLTEGVALLDQRERAGWRLLQRLIQCHLGWREPVRKATAKELSEHEWFDGNLPELGEDWMGLGSVPTEDVAFANWDVWLEAWQGRLSEWWLALPGATQESLRGCFGALSLFLAARLQTLLGRAAPPPPAAAADADACEWVEATSSSLDLPDFPDLPAPPEEFRAPVLPLPGRLLPELLPDWRVLQSMGGLSRHGERPQRSAHRREKPAALLVGAAAGAGAALLAIAFMYSSRGIARCGLRRRGLARGG